MSASNEYGILEVSVSNITFVEWTLITSDLVDNGSEKLVGPEFDFLGAKFRLVSFFY